MAKLSMWGSLRLAATTVATMNMATTLRIAKYCLIIVSSPDKGEPTARFVLSFQKCSAAAQSLYLVLQ